MIRIISLIVALSLVAVGIWLVYEPELMKAATSDTVVLTQQVSTGLAITDCANVAFNPSPRSGFGDGTVASASCTWNVKTANAAGFSMSLKASSDPALCTIATNDTCGSNPSFADYTETQNGTPDYTWSVTTGAEFGYTVEPASPEDTVQKFKDNGSACGVGTNNGTDTCWIDFSTTDFNVVNRSQKTGTSGENIIVKFWNEIETDTVQTAGTYTAGITATVVDN